MASIAAEHQVCEALSTRHCTTGMATRLQTPTTQSGIPTFHIHPCPSAKPITVSGVPALQPTMSPRMDRIYRESARGGSRPAPVATAVSRVTTCRHSTSLR